LAVVPIAQDELPFYVDIVWAMGQEAVIEQPREAVDLMKRKVLAVASQYHLPDEALRNE